MTITNFKIGGLYGWNPKTGSMDESARTDSIPAIAEKVNTRRGMLYRGNPIPPYVRFLMWTNACLLVSHVKDERGFEYSTFLVQDKIIKLRSPTQQTLSNKHFFIELNPSDYR